MIALLIILVFAVVSTLLFMYIKHNNMLRQTNDIYVAHKANTELRASSQELTQKMKNTKKELNTKLTNAVRNLDTEHRALLETMNMSIQDTQDMVAGLEKDLAKLKLRLSNEVSTKKFRLGDTVLTEEELNIMLESS